jgi:hypothetical protein
MSAGAASPRANRVHSSASRPASAALPIVAGLVAIIVRLPFLLKDSSFFTADEGVEGLMARHLGDLPVFFWGQGHKGVPEVYVDGAVFAIFGVGVIQLRSVTLAIWAIAVALLVRLTERWHGRMAATIAALLLVTGPAAVVNFSLVGSAEFALLTAVIALLLLDYQRGMDATPPVMPPRVCFWCGLAIWIHPAAASAVAALAVIVVLRSERWNTPRWRGVADVVLARDRPQAVRMVTLLLHGLITLTFVFFAFTWLGGSLQWGPVKLSNSLRQLQNATILIVLAVLIRQTTGDSAIRTRTAAALSWFLAGLSPVLIHLLRGGSLRLTATHVTTGTREGIFKDALASAAGLRDALGHSLGLPSWTILGFTLGVSVATGIAIHAIIAAKERGTAVQPKDVFPVLAAFVAAGALVAGGLQDAGSSRHLIPFVVVLMVALASAIVWLWKRSRVVAIGLTVWMLLGFAWSEYRWYRQLEPDDSSPALLQCLEDQRRYFATADYADAYRLTFLSHERVIVVPDKGIDRYPPYRQKVQAAPDGVHIEGLTFGADAAATGDVLCRTPLLMARRIRK